MNVGLQINNANGQPLFDSTVNTTRVLGTFDTGTANGSKSIGVPEGLTLWAAVNYVNYRSIGSGNGASYPKIKVNGNVISWTFPTASNWLFDSVVTVSVNIIYGVL